MSKVTLSGVGILVAVFAGGCASEATSVRLNEKLAKEDTHTTSAELNQKSGELIRSAPGLSDTQRSQLMELRANTRTQSEEIGRESNRLRSVLVKDLVSPAYDQEEVDLIKSRLKELEERRLKVLFSSVEKANNILGRDALKHTTMVNDFMMERPVGRID